MIRTLLPDSVLATLRRQMGCMTGMELEDIHAARHEALQAARDMLADQLRAGEALDGQRIEITAVDGRVLDVVSFREALRPAGTIH